MKKIIILVAAFFACIFSAFSQEISAHVTVNMEQVDYELRRYAQNMQRDLENYINNQKFSDKDWDGDKIPVEVTIVLSGGTNGVFNARLVVMSQRTLDGPTAEAGHSLAAMFVDNKWKFEYGMGGGSLTYNTLRFDNFTTMIDFYMLLVIGVDLDSYTDQGGSNVFDKAKSLVALGAAQQADGWDMVSSPGDYTKYNLANELTDMKIGEFRSLIASYYACLDKLEFNKDKAVSDLANVIDAMAQFKHDRLSSSSIYMQMFFETKAKELASVFNGNNNQDLFNNLVYLDPSDTELFTRMKNGNANSNNQ